MNLPLRADGRDSPKAGRQAEGVTLESVAQSSRMKQAIVARTDIGMGAGKLAAQVAHASLRAYERADRTAREEWTAGGQKKIVLRGDNERQLFGLAEEADREGLPHAVVRDAGHTQLEPGTVTALAVGPAAEDRVDLVTGELSLY